VPLTVLAIADEVSRTLYDCFDRDRWANVDCILSCGDLPPWYLDFLCSSLTIPVFYVRGNHDAGYQPSEYDGSENIHGKVVDFKGVRIAGFEGSTRYNGAPLQHTEREMNGAIHRARLSARRMGAPDIILTHAPPAGPHAGADLCHAGFQAFNSAIRLWEPQLLIHGHMHSYLGKQTPYASGTTTILNAFPYRLLQVASRPRVASGSVLKRYLSKRPASETADLTRRNA
jgi:Icc-related predicted phosphoesterase